jgi:hypothetical protein
MAKDPRPPPPGSPERDEALDLLRALARARANEQHEPAPPSGDEKLDALRELAAKLDFQLRGLPPATRATELPEPPPADARPSGPRSSGSRPPPSSSPAPPLRRPGPPPDSDEPPSHAPWRARFRREWRALVAALPEAATLVPRFNRGHFVFVAISLVVLMAALIGNLVGLRRPQVGPDQMIPPVAPATPTEPGASLAPLAPPTDLASITKEMTDCDNLATKDPNTIHFLVLPLVPAKGAENDWRSVALSEVGNSFLLLSGGDALDGLRDGKLTVRPGRYTFAIRDPGSGQSYAWTSATSLTRLSRPLSKDVKRLNLGFDFSPGQSGTTWSSDFNRDPGTCYWVIVLVRQ